MADFEVSDVDKRNKAMTDIADYEFDVEKKPEPELMKDLAEENCKFFKDQYGKGYALVKIHSPTSHYESIPLDSNRFKSYLIKLYYDENFHKIPHKENINSAIELLKAKAEFEGNTIPLKIRVSWSKDRQSIYYDLTEENWYVIRISKNGYYLEMDIDFPLFKRYKPIAQPIPDKNFSSDTFDKFMSLINVKDEQEILLVKAWIISTFIPDIIHTILNIHGGQDSAKTTTQKLIKHLVDPDKPDNLLSINHDKMEFIQQLSHRHIIFYDNLKSKRSIPWLPEEVCKAVTGGGSTKRALYSDDDDVIYDFKVCIGFNGINMIMNEPDVLRRSVIIESREIDEKDKIPETVIYSTAEELKPYVLSYIFDIVSKAMSIKDTLEFTSYPGIADFAIWGEAISRAMGYKDMEFIEAYRQNIRKQNQHVIDIDPFAKSVSLLYDELFTDQESNLKLKFRFNAILNTYSVSINNYLEELKGIAFRHSIDTIDNRFPKGENALSHHLRIVKTNLRSKGIEVIIRQSRTKEDVANGFPRNTTIIEMKPVMQCRDDKDDKDVCTPFSLKKKEDREGLQEEYQKEGLTKTLIIPTILTNRNYSLMFIYLNHMQHGLMSCPNCSEIDQAYYMTNVHNCVIDRGD